MSEKAAAPIIIIKKVSGHGGHHGGAWKVAYADFVTAMMALFIVLWLLNSSAKVQEAVGGYFRDPLGHGKQTGSGQAGTGEDLTIAKDDMHKLKEKLDAAVKANPKLEDMKNQIKITVTGEGLRVELLETEKGMFFSSGSSDPSAAGREILASLAAQLGKLPNSVLIEGHTDAQAFTSKAGYSNWELSADRANAARRYMQDQGLRDHQVAQVRGFADQRLFKPKDPTAAANRRISIIVQYQQAVPGPDEEPGKAGHGEKKSEHGAVAEHGAAAKPSGEAKKTGAAPEHGAAPKPAGSEKAEHPAPAAHGEGKPSPVPKH